MVSVVKSEELFKFESYQRQATQASLWKRQNLTTCPTATNIEDRVKSFQDGKMETRDTNSTDDFSDDEDVARIRAKVLARHVTPRVKPIVRDEDDPSMPPPPMHYMPPPPPPPVPGTAMPPPSPVLTRTTRMGSMEFKQKSTFSAIEVLLEEPRVTMRSRSKGQASSGQVFSNPDTDAVQPVLTQIPTKIRIRSPVLLIVLEEIARTSGHAFSAKNQTQYLKSHMPTVS
jgi:hypothetical protein